MAYVAWKLNDLCGVASFLFFAEDHCELQTFYLDHERCLCVFSVGIDINVFDGALGAISNPLHVWFDCILGDAQKMQGSAKGYSFSVVQ